MALTAKMKAFCREYVRCNDATQAYLNSYNGNSKATAQVESGKLLQRDDITEFLETLYKPLQNKAINEREKKRTIIWEGIQKCRENGDHNGVARYMDILNKMDAEYINVNRNIEEKTDISTIDNDTLKKLVAEE